MMPWKSPYIQVQSMDWGGCLSSLYSAHTLRSHLITGFQLELAFKFLMLLWWKSQGLTPPFLTPTPDTPARVSDTWRLWGRKKEERISPDKRWPGHIAKVMIMCGGREGDYVSVLCCLTREWMESRDGRRRCCGGRRGVAFFCLS